MIKRLTGQLSVGLVISMLLQPVAVLAQSSPAPVVPGGNAGNPTGTTTSEQSPFAPSATTPAITPRSQISPMFPSTGPGATTGIQPPVTPSGQSMPIESVGSPALEPGFPAENQSVIPPRTTAEQEQEITPGQLPEGTMAPVTLKARLEKNSILPLTLEQALQLSLGENIAIQIADENVRLSHLNYLLRLSDLLPDVTLQYTQSRFTGAIQIFGGSVMDIYRTTYQPQITANYIIYTGGSNIFAIKASKQREEAQKNLAEDTRQSTLSQVAQAYYDLQQSYLQRAIALQAIAEATEQVNLNKARETSGIGIRLDVLQAQTSLSAAQELLIFAENQIGQNSENLAQLLNLDFEVDLVPQTLDTYVVRLLPEDLVAPDLLEIMLCCNPRLKALLAESQASRTDIKTAITSYFPQIGISAYYNQTGPAWNNLQPAQFAGIQATTNVLSNMGTEPIITVKQTRTQAQIAQLNYDNAERILERDLSNALINLKALKDRIELARQTLVFARSTYENAFGRMQAGVGTNIDLQNALTNLTRARSNLATTFIDYNKAQVVLLAVMGVATPQTLTQGYTPAVPASTP